MDTYKQIDWIKQQILDQVDAAIENFTLIESGEQKTLEFSKIVVENIINRIDVMHALDIHHYLHEIGVLDNIKCKDRLQCLYEYFYQWIELELATRYA
jgi:hypothetical protein